MGQATEKRGRSGILWCLNAHSEEQVMPFQWAEVALGDQKWQASIKNTVRGHVVFREQMSHQSWKWLSCSYVFSVSTAREFHCEKGARWTIFGERIVFFRRLWTGQHCFSITLLSLATTCLTWFCVRNDVYLLPTFEPECLGLLKNISAHSWSFAECLCLCLFSCKFFSKEVFPVTLYVRRESDCWWWNANHWWQWHILQMLVLQS